MAWANFDIEYVLLIYYHIAVLTKLLRRKTETVRDCAQFRPIGSY